jgi:hypothetical protein
MDSGVACVIECFPKHAASIRGRFGADQSFPEICGDDAETVAARQRWQASSGPHLAARIEKYRALARTLEIETVAPLGPPT